MGCGDPEPDPTPLGVCSWCAADGKRIEVKQDAVAPGSATRKWLTIPETALLLDCSRDKVSRLIARRVLAATVVSAPLAPRGNRWRVWRTSVDDFLRSQETDASSAA